MDDKFDKNKPSTMFVQPMFNYKSEEWLAMIYGWPEVIEENSTFMMGFAFKTKAYAKEFFGLLSSYNNGEQIDKNNNVRISLITEDPENYSVYIYPSHERKNVIENQKDMEDKFGTENQHLIAQLTICRYFPYGEKSSFKKFKELYKQGNPVELRAFTLKEGNIPVLLEDIDPIIKNDIRIQHRKLLDKDDLEYQHHKEIIKQRKGLN